MIVALENFRKCKILKVYFIKTICPALNKKLDTFNTFYKLYHLDITFNCPLAILFIALLKNFEVIKIFNFTCKLLDDVIYHEQLCF